MAFTNPRLDEIAPVGGGQGGTDGLTLTADVFEDGLVVGRFAKLDTGSIDNLDASVTPVIAGVVLRNVVGAIEEGGTVDASIHQQIEYKREGLVTVEVVTGQVPVQFGAVSVHNVADANAGKALATGGVAVNAEFIREVKTDVWLVNLFNGV